MDARAFRGLGLVEMLLAVWSAVLKRPAPSQMAGRRGRKCAGMCLLMRLMLTGLCKQRTAIVCYNVHEAVPRGFGRC